MPGEGQGVWLPIKGQPQEVPQFPFQLLKTDSWADLFVLASLPVSLQCPVKPSKFTDPGKKGNKEMVSLSHD